MTVTKDTREALVAQLCELVAREMAGRAQRGGQGPLQGQPQALAGPGPGQQQPKAPQPAAGASQQAAPVAQQGAGLNKRSWAAAAGAGPAPPSAGSPASAQRRPAGPSSQAAAAAPAATLGGVVRPCGPLLRGQPHTLVLGHTASPQGEPGALLCPSRPLLVCAGGTAGDPRARAAPRLVPTLGTPCCE
jgi:hypothetical protein